MKFCFGSFLTFAAALKVSQKATDQVQELSTQESNKQALSDWENNTKHYLDYCAKYGKHYETLSEFRKRHDQYNTNDFLVQRHNNKKDTSYQMGHNIFSDEIPLVKPSLILDQLTSFKE
jgi:hypothetical protein